MTIDEYGPVPVSRLKPEANHIFEALEGGARVLVSRFGELAAVIEPHQAISPAVIAAYSTPRELPFADLSAAEINQASPSENVRLAVELLEPSYVTKHAKVYGILLAREVSPGVLPLTFRQAEQVDQMVEEFLAQEQSSNADEIAEFTAAAQQLVRDSARTSAIDAGGPNDPLHQIALTLMGRRRSYWNIGIGKDSYSARFGFVPWSDAAALAVLSQFTEANETDESTLHAVATGDVRAMLRIGRELAGSGRRDAAIAWYRLAMFGDAPQPAVVGPPSPTELKLAKMRQPAQLIARELPMT